MFPHRQPQVVLVLVVLIQELVSNAKVLLKRKSIASPKESQTRIALMLGLKTVIQTEMSLLLLIQVELELGRKVIKVLSQESALNAKVSPKSKVNTTRKTNCIITSVKMPDLAPTTCQTATELTEPQVLTAAMSEESMG